MTTPGRCCGIKLLIKEFVSLLGALSYYNAWLRCARDVACIYYPLFTPYFPHVLTLIEGLLPRKDGVQRAATVGVHTLTLKALLYYVGFERAEARCILLVVESELKTDNLNKYIDIIISQNTTQFMYICTIFHNDMFRPIFRPSSGCSLA